ncbi:gliding motility-associated peptidyl-prolyl isomerase GldI [Flavobacterium sp. HXWNR69]|uniref:Peptidyl-prolyl cis-trans isomerase n=1 Tax=Flavobacterium fragile TaxID=2949085 RepID=A0ABT0TFS4_9FLAO|nr:gliding motility-associated peptidyl-prolyl isomerase GldI [Flavobacterium sp. HXWNR69]MCL9769837.1 gliding motility-associated peptidyl-prolyl isomerase GldI [Flavobacterium sp. HXWNR69]
MKLQTLLLLGTFIFFASCSQQQQQARKPISHTSGTFIKESIERNKILIADEEYLIAEIIKKDSLKSYISSNKGYWYKYETKVNEATPTPKRGDIAFFDYEIKDLKNRIIYTMAETKPQTYYVDKENIMMGLRDGIKLMKKGEIVTFLFPSHMAYGYHGDDKKIGTNEPLICTVSLNDIKEDTQAKN